MYITLAVLHTIFSIAWLGLLPAGVFLMRKIRGAAGTPSEVGLLRTYLRVVTAGTYMGGIGILATGIPMSSMSGWGFFSFDETPWLAFKQVFTLLALLIIFSAVMPTAKSIGAILVKIPEGVGLPDSRARESAQTFTIASYAVQAAVLISIMLSIARPG